MGTIGEKARQLSFNDLKIADVNTKYGQILEILKDNKPHTARQVENAMIRKGFVAYFDMNHVRPRLTELTQAGLIKEEGLILDEFTHKKVTAYKAIAR